MKIYTQGGDAGQTGLLGGHRVWKNSPCLEVIGALDELNSMLGLIRAEPLPEEVSRILEPLQNALFVAGSELASVGAAEQSCPRITREHIHALEAAIDRCQAKLPPIKGFILPGGVRSAAMLHIARTICRRAERHLAALVQSDKKAVSSEMLAYINRVSDLLFVLARLSNALAGISDALWKKAPVAHD